MGFVTSDPDSYGKKNNSKDSFRSDINALRALAVLAVVGYHFQIPGFSGGFVGVDIFLVISGYLITGQVLSHMTAGRFKFSEFAMMRVRRIYPALIAVVVTSVFVGWQVTQPGEYLKHLRQALSALFFVSNFAFSSDNGYFALAAQTKPLLHTWSLSVEWQFYIWMPLIVWLIWRVEFFARSRLRAEQTFLWLITVVSLMWCLWQSVNDVTGSSYFSLRSRAWELLAGSLIVAAEIRRRTVGEGALMWPKYKIQALAGWALVVGSIVYPIPESSWPGLLSLAPIGGAALVIGARQWADGSGVTGWSPLQRIGDWSYSIYLWHWPIWVFTVSWLSLRGYTIDAPEKLLMGLATLIISYISYRFVEQPFRLHKAYWSPRRLLAVSAAVILLFLLFMGLAFRNKGFPERMPDHLLSAELVKRTKTPRNECFRSSDSTKKAAEDYCSFGAETGKEKPALILWGDSIANQYLEPVTSAAKHHGLSGMIATMSGCRAFIDDPVMNDKDTAPCRAFNRKTLAFLLENAQPGIVVLGMNWGCRKQKETLLEEKSRESGTGIRDWARRLLPAPVDKPRGSGNSAWGCPMGELSAPMEMQQTACPQEEVSALVDKLLDSGKTVVLILPLLRIGFDVPQCWVANQIRAGGAISEWKLKASPDLLMSDVRSGIDAIAKRHKHNPKLILIDPVPQVCDLEDCYLVKNGQANFSDTLHVSNINVGQYNRIFDEAIKSALASGSKVEPLDR